MIRENTVILFILCSARAFRTGQRVVCLVFWEVSEKREAGHIKVDIEQLQSRTRTTPNHSLVDKEMFFSVRSWKEREAEDRCIYVYALEDTIIV